MSKVPTTSDLLRATSAELSRFLGVWPVTPDSVKHHLLVQGRNADQTPSMTIGSYALDEGDKVQAVMRAFHVGLVMGAQRAEEIMALLERYPPGSD